MEAVKTAESNHNFGPPQGYSESQIGNLPCCFEETEYGRFVFSVWEPTPEERQAIANGQNIRLGVGWIGAFPPVSLGTTHLTRED